MNKIEPKAGAYFLLRLAMGVNMLGHGLVRFPKLTPFMNWMGESFSNTFLSDFLVMHFALALPFIEFIIGVLLILGYRTNATIYVGQLLMIFLIFGSCLIEKWEWASAQMVYVLFYYLLQIQIGFNHFSIDGLRSKNH